MIANIPSIPPDEFSRALVTSMLAMAKSGMSPNPTVDQFIKALTKHSTQFFKDKPERAKAFAVRFSTAYRALQGKPFTAVPPSLWEHIAAAPLEDGGAFEEVAFRKAAGWEK